jgi:hypothetical protein
MRAKKQSPRKVAHMSTISVPTLESLKKKSKVIRKFLNEKYNVDVSQGHCLELISKVFGFKDWNTASAALKPKIKENSAPFAVETVGELKKALEPFKDSDRIDAQFTFKLIDFLKHLDDDDPESEIHQGFSISLDTFDGDPVLKLKLEYEDLMSSGPEMMMRSLR